MLLQSNDRSTTLISCILVYIGFGLLILYSASDQNLATVYSQLSKTLMGLILMMFLRYLPMRYIKDFVEPLYIASIIILIMILLIGTTGKGATRWLNLGIIKFQPSELIKLTLPLMLAKLLSKDDSINTNYLLPICVTLLPIALVIKQPDLGTALMISFIAAIIIFSSGLPSIWIKSILITSGITLPIIWHYGLHNYQKARIMNFLNPGLDPQGSGYNIIQSKIAVGSGGLIGQGWLHGTQIHLKFLPEHATDFIFGVVAQEFGLLGSLFLITLIVIIVYQILIFSLTTNDTFSQLLCFGLASHFLLSAIINIGMVIGVFPVVGIPLSLVSYAGTHGIIILIGFGMILSCMRTESMRLIK